MKLETKANFKVTFSIHSPYYLLLLGQPDDVIRPSLTNEKLSSWPDDIIRLTQREDKSWDALLCPGMVASIQLCQPCPCGQPCDVIRPTVTNEKPSSWPHVITRLTTRLTAPLSRYYGLR